MDLETVLAQARGDRVHGASKVASRALDGLADHLRSRRLGGEPLTDAARLAGARLASCRPAMASIPNGVVDFLAALE